MKARKLNYGWLLLLPVLVSTWNYSCKNTPKNPKELAAADSMRVNLRIADSLLKTLDRERVEEEAEDIITNSNAIQEGINKLQDTLDLKTATFLTEYRSIVKILETFAENSKRIQGAIDTMKVTCDNLAHDLRNNTLAEGLDPVKAVASEREKVNKLIGELNYLIPAVNMGLRKNDSLAPQIKAYITEMNRKLSEKAASGQHDK